MTMNEEILHNEIILIEHLYDKDVDYFLAKSLHLGCA